MKFHYRVHKSSTYAPILCQINHVHSRILFLRLISILSILLRLGLQSGIFPSSFPTETLCTLLLSSMRPTCCIHHILIYFVIRKIFGECSSQSYPVCSVVTVCTYIKHLLASAWTIIIIAQAVLISSEQCQTNGLSPWDGMSSGWGWERRPADL